MDIRSYFKPGISVVVELEPAEVRNLRKDFEDISWTQKPTLHALVEEILDYADDEEAL